MENKKENRGGARLNAGRKPAKEKRKAKTFRVSESEELQVRAFIKKIQRESLENSAKQSLKNN